MASSSWTTGSKKRRISQPLGCEVRSTSEAAEDDLTTERSPIDDANDQDCAVPARSGRNICRFLILADAGQQVLCLTASTCIALGDSDVLPSLPPPALLLLPREALLGQAGEEGDADLSSLGSTRYRDSVQP